MDQNRLHCSEFRQELGGIDQNPLGHHPQLLTGITVRICISILVLAPVIGPARVMRIMAAFRCTLMHAKMNGKRKTR